MWPGISLRNQPSQLQRLGPLMGKRDPLTIGFPDATGKEFPLPVRRTLPALTSPYHYAFECFWSSPAVKNLSTSHFNQCMEDEEASLFPSVEPPQISTPQTLAYRQLSCTLRSPAPTQQTSAYHQPTFMPSPAPLQRTPAARESLFMPSPQAPTQQTSDPRLRSFIPPSANSSQDHAVQARPQIVSTPAPNSASTLTSR